jgi:hypothetical protein
VYFASAHDLVYYADGDKGMAELGQDEKPAE